MTHEYLTQHAGKKLVLSYDIHVEVTAYIGDDSLGMSRAVDDCMRASGIGNGTPGIRPETMTFRVEES
jgi:hypothetical protein